MRGKKLAAGIQRVTMTSNDRVGVRGRRKE
jgi:hypothetical protein